MILSAGVSSVGWHTPATHRNGRKTATATQLLLSDALCTLNPPCFFRQKLQSPHVLDMVFFKKMISSIILDLNKNLHITDLLIISSVGVSSDFSD